MSKQQGNSLEKFKLYYEELEKKVAKAKPAIKTAKSKTPSKPKTTLTTRLKSAKKTLRGQFDNVVTKLVQPRKKVKKLTKKEKQALLEQKKRGIIGIGLLFVVVSIAYSTYMTNLFVDGTLMWVALTPQIAFAVVTLLIAFYKIYK